MEISSCSCLCGNVQVKGQLILNDVEKDCFQFCQTIFSIQSNSIEILNKTKIKKSSQNKSCIQVKCLQCRTLFSIFSYEKGIYMEKSCFANQLGSGKDNLNDQSLHQFYKFTRLNNLDHRDSRFIINFSSLNDTWTLNDREGIHYQKPCSHVSSKINSMNNHIDDFNTSPKQEIIANLFDRKCDENDTDFEIMFSNKYDPFVGSYTL